MPDIVLTTLNAKYLHAAFGLRCLLANLGPLQSRARVMEFDINQRPVDIAEALLAQNPRIIGLGVYIFVFPDDWPKPFYVSMGPPAAEAAGRSDCSYSQLIRRARADWQIRARSARACHW